MAFNLGRTTTTTSSGAAVDGMKYAGGWVAPSNGYITTLNAYLHRAAAGTTNCKMAVYGPVAEPVLHTPKHCEGNAAMAVSNTAAAWKSVGVNAFPAVTYNQKYWISLHPNGDVQIHRNTTGGDHAVSWDTYSDGPEPEWGNSSSTGVYEYCFYAGCVQKYSLAGQLIATGLLTADFEAAQQLHGELTAQGILTAALTLGGQLRGSLISTGEAEAYLRRGVPLSGELTAKSVLTAILATSGRFWDAPPRHITLCPRCGAPQVDSLMTRCSACGFSFQQRF